MVGLKLAGGAGVSRPPVVFINKHIARRLEPGGQMISLILAISFITPQTADPYFGVPAGRQVARVVPGGVTILPNGRLLTPRGKRLWVKEDLWQILLSPNQKTVVAFHDGGFTAFADATAATPGGR